MFTVENQHFIDGYMPDEVFPVTIDSELWQHTQNNGDFGLRIACDPGTLAVGKYLEFDIALPMISSKIKSRVIDFETNQRLILDGRGNDVDLFLEFGFSALAKQAGTQIDYRAEVRSRSLRSKLTEPAVKAFVRANVGKGLASGLIDKISVACNERYPRLSA